MKFYDHKNLTGLHAPFTASQSSWLRYDDDKLLEVYANKKAAQMGTRLHEWAAETIKLGLKQPKSKKTICAYVNDAIGFQMEPEVVLYYSDRFFGTADTISFRNGVLRIHDLKTGKIGKIEDHMDQLEVYAALFCLEYKVKPNDIKIELRVYKCDEVCVWNPEPDAIVLIMNKIVHSNALLEKYDREEE